MEEMKGGSTGVGEGIEGTADALSQTMQVLSLNRPESWLTHPPGQLWRDKWTVLSGPFSAGESWARWGLGGLR